MEGNDQIKEQFHRIKNVGTIHDIQVFKGVTLGYYDLKVDHWKGEEMTPAGANIIEINHCQKGRFECEFINNSFYYLGEDNLAISRVSDKKTHSGFPLGMYSGINILIDLDQCEAEFFELLGNFLVNTDRLVEKWRHLLPCKIFQESRQINYIFKELYELEEAMNIGYLKCKVVELMVLFDQYKIGLATTHQHFGKGQVEKAKHIRMHLEEELDREITLAELAREHEISESTIKRCFEAIYGKTPTQYRKEFRMQVAAKQLLETNDSVSEIGMQVGYLNPSKFSNAFRLVMKLSPSEYRNEKKTQ
ncbi:MAG: AraC family transcriptional regulator [bacterium]|nr:AraC family transcriptional regulator [bacterium]